MADEHTFGVELVTPESALLAGEAVALICRTSEGDLTVLNGHTALVGDVVPGVVRVDLPDGTTKGFAVHGGFLQVATAPGAAVGLVEGATDTDRSTRVTLLAGIAEPVGEVDAVRAHAAMEAATAKMAELASRDDEESVLERERAGRAVARAELRIEAAGATTAQ